MTVRGAVAAAVLSVAIPWGVPTRGQESPLEGSIEAVSLLGQELVRPVLRDDFAAAQERLLTQARATLETHPDDPEAIVWVGRRTAYLGRYREAIQIFTSGLHAHPDFAPLYRHRGHRYITVRRLEAAIADLVRGFELARSEPDRVEPDGLPNPLGIPTSTLKSNLTYHLGLAHYLRGDFEAAAAAYRQCLSYADNPDMQVATRYWLYLSLRRLGREVEARQLLKPIDREVEVIENHDYLRLLLVYKGEIAAANWGREVEASAESLSAATVGYGLGVWNLLQGDRDAGKAIFLGILSTGQWAAFGFIAAEAELSRWAEQRRPGH